LVAKARTEAESWMALVVIYTLLILQRTSLLTEYQRHVINLKTDWGTNS